MIWSRRYYNIWRIFTWGAAEMTGKSYSLKRLISFMFDRLSPSLCTGDANSACPWALWFVHKIKCTSFCCAVLQCSTNKMERHGFVTNFHTYSPSKSGGANAPPAPPCAPALWRDWDVLMWLYLLLIRTGTSGTYEGGIDEWLKDDHILRDVNLIT